MSSAFAHALCARHSPLFPPMPHVLSHAGALQPPPPSSPRHLCTGARRARARAHLLRLEVFERVRHRRPPPRAPPCCAARSEWRRRRAPSPSPLAAGSGSSALSTSSPIAAQAGRISPARPFPATNFAIRLPPFRPAGRLLGAVCLRLPTPLSLSVTQVRSRPSHHMVQVYFRCNHGSVVKRFDGVVRERPGLAASSISPAGGGRRRLAARAPGPAPARAPVPSSPPAPHPRLGGPSLGSHIARGAGRGGEGGEGAGEPLRGPRPGKRPHASAAGRFATPRAWGARRRRRGRGAWAGARGGRAPPRRWRCTSSAWKQAWMCRSTLQSSKMPPQRWRASWTAC